MFIETIPKNEAGKVLYKNLLNIFGSPISNKNHVLFQQSLENRPRKNTENTVNKANALWKNKMRFK